MKGREVQAKVTPWVSRGEHRAGWGGRPVALDSTGHKTMKVPPCLQESFDFILPLLGSYERVVSR